MCIRDRDGSVQLQLAETEIGQGADTAFSQMAAEELGIPLKKAVSYTHLDVYKRQGQACR